MPRISFALLVLMLGAAGAQGQDPHGPAARLDPSHQAFLRQYCHAGHSAQTQKGKPRLDDLPFTLDSVERADLWQKVLKNLNSGEMPPQEEPQPRPEAKATFLEALSQTMVLARRHLSDSGGRITLRRLNQREYKNSIRDLLGVEVNARELPADGGAGTFDTVGSSLFMSSDQVEQYLALGREALDNHFSRFIGSAPTQVTPIHIEAEARHARIALMNAAATSNGLPPWTPLPPCPTTLPWPPNCVLPNPMTTRIGTASGSASRARTPTRSSTCSTRPAT